MIRSTLFLLILLVGCNPTPPTLFYTLASPQARIERPETATQTIALAPIVLPAYLDRPQIVSRLDDTRMEIADFHSWIEPLDTLVQRTLAANLQTGSSVAQVVRLPQRRPIAFDYGVEVSIDRFETTNQGEAWIDADWVLIDGREEAVARGAFIRQLPVSEPLDFAERSLALSQLLNELGLEILNAIEQPAS